MSDEIIKELWAVKDRSAKDAAYDIDKLCRHLQELDRKTTAPVLDLSRNRHRETTVVHRR